MVVLQVWNGLFAAAAEVTYSQQMLTKSRGKSRPKQSQLMELEEGEPLKFVGGWRRVFMAEFDCYNSSNMKLLQPPIEEDSG